MSQLLRRDLIAALAPVGVPNCDIVVTDEIGDRLCAVQVKTQRAIGSDGGWHMKRKHEVLRSPTLFYAFVDFGDSSSAPASTFIVPAVIVGEVLERSHRKWLSTPGSRGQVHSDGEMRRFLPDYSRFGFSDRGPGWLDDYHNAWDVLTASGFSDLSAIPS